MSLRASAGLLLWACGAAEALAQDMQPRRWTHLPVNTNVADVTYAYSAGDLHFDPALRIEDARIDMHTILLSYNHYFSLGDLTARADVQLPIQSGQWKGLLDGVPRSVGRSGLGDPRIRFSMNFIGSPALEGEEFQEFIRSRENRTTAGVALAAQSPAASNGGRDRAEGVGESEPS